MSTASRPLRHATPPVLITAAVLAALGFVACGRSGARAPAGNRASIAADSDRFPHALHSGDDPRIQERRGGKGMACAECHPAAAVVRGELARPGANQHAPCDECHKAEFYKLPGPFCRVCHSAVEPRVAGQSPLAGYPERGFSKVLAAEFSHEAHLDAGEMEGAVGFHLNCGDCHLRAEKSRDPMLPGHAQCARCHEGQKAAKAALPMLACERCHPSRDVELRRGRRFITGDLIFAHADHEQDLAGQAIACQSCHADVASSESSADVSVPEMQRCAVCHEDARKTPERVRIAHCETCHTEITSGSAPTSHMMGSDLPEDHNLEFRRNHTDQAKNPQANCRYCHNEMTATGRDTCFQCHEVMRPRDHGLAWRDDSHGREAQVDGDRCATCHQADYCTACHSVPPRSHQPYEEFRLGGHAEAARFDATSCMACHTATDTCSDCHRGIR